MRDIEERIIHNLSKMEITSSSEECISSKPFNKETYLQNLQKKRTAKKKINYSFQELGENMAQFFPKRQSSFLWTLFWKYKEGDIYDAFQICRQKGVRNVAYLLAIIRNKKQHAKEKKEEKGRNI